MQAAHRGRRIRALAAIGSQGSWIRILSKGCLISWDSARRKGGILDNFPSDVDPDPIGSAFIWVHGSGSRGIKLSEKQSLFLPIFFLVGNYIF